jgi:hypothetical protein
MDAEIARITPLKRMTTKIARRKAAFPTASKLARRRPRGVYYGPNPMRTGLQAVGIGASLLRDR